MTDSIYLDKLDGRIDAGFFDRKATDWRREQDGILRNIPAQQDADQNYIKDGIQLLGLASEATNSSASSGLRSSAGFSIS